MYIDVYTYISMFAYAHINDERAHHHHQLNKSDTNDLYIYIPDGEGVGLLLSLLIIEASNKR
jgi:hypothetical protein